MDTEVEEWNARCRICVVVGKEERDRETGRLILKFSLEYWLDATEKGNYISQLVARSAQCL